VSTEEKSTHDQRITVLLGRSKSVDIHRNTHCLFCHYLIPANSRGYVWSGYGSRPRVDLEKFGGHFHQGCFRRILRTPILSKCFVLNTQPSPERLAAEIRSTVTANSLLAEWEIVEHPSGCLVIVGRKGGKRFSGNNECRPRKKIKGVNKTIASIVYQLGGGEKEPDDVIRHTCDVSTCVELDHLVAGSRSDNVREGFTRGRHDKRYKGLTPCQKVKLTLSDRLERMARYGDPDWFEGWENGRDEWLAQQ